MQKKKCTTIPFFILSYVVYCEW